MPEILGINGFIAIPVLFILASWVLRSIRRLYEYERGVVFTLGKYTGTRGPGLTFIVPVLQSMRVVDMRLKTAEIPRQEVMTKDNIPMLVNAVVYFRVIDPEKAIIQVEKYLEAVSQLAQTTLRSVLGQHELDDMLAERDKLNKDIQSILDRQTDAWGIKVANVEIKHVDLDESMIRAMAKQAEAERTRRAKIIHAEGEKQAAQQLVEAARTLGSEPKALQLRYLQTLSDLSSEKATTIVFPLPMDLIKPFLDRSK